MLGCFDSCLSIDVEGRGGGMAMLWPEGSHCRLVNYSRSFINIIVEDAVRRVWRLTCYYGYPQRNRRREACNLL